MRTTVKHLAASTVKRTVPYKDFCIFFINRGWLLTLSLRILYCTIVQVHTKKELKKKGLITLNVIDNIKWKLGVLQFHSAYTRAAPGCYSPEFPGGA
jgi:hypothetical protein